MFLPNPQLLKFSLLSLGSAIILALLPLAGLAQDGAAPDQTYAVISSVNAPRGVIAEEYRNLASRQGGKSDVQYVTELSGLLASGKAQPASRAERPRNSLTMNLNGSGGFFALVIVIGALFLWLKFGGSGILLSRDPTESVKKNSAPDSWKISASDVAKDAGSMLKQIAAMSDRSAAMVLLLRYCLLTAAQSTGSRFARSDTERSAFKRLPDNWRHHDGMEMILKQAELAHYGGRPVANDEFELALKTGRIILNVNPPAEAAHG